MKKKTLPGQRNGESLDAYIKRSWESEPGVQPEFGSDFDAYAAYCRAEAANSVKILGAPRGFIKKIA